MKFRTIEISDPKFETDGLRYLTVKSAALKGRVDVSVYIPGQAKNQENLPVIVLLHGVYGSHWAWTLKGGIHRTLAKMVAAQEVQPFILVMPSDGLWGDGSGYVPHYQQNFQKWIGEEVPAIIRQQIKEVGGLSNFYISGLSMGGYGAIRIGTLYSEIYRGISAHSSLTNVSELQDFVVENWSKGLKNQNFDALIDLIKRHRKTLPPLRFDCGKADGLFKANELLHQQLTEVKVSHQFEVFEGRHSWEYWSKYIQQTFHFFEKLECQPK